MAEQQAEQQFAIQRLFVKDSSFEVPDAPEVFKQEWKPELNLDINTSSKKLDDDNYEVLLRLTVNVKNSDKNAFVAEVNYGGVFTIKGLNEEQLSHTIGSFCPNIIYPYAREEITRLVSSGSFPQLILAPVNFDALYAQHQAEAAKQKEA